MNGVENEEFWKEFILLYREFPELWQVRNEHFKNKSMKQKACQTLLMKLREIQPYATDSTLKRKLNILKDSFRRELNKVRRSELINDNPEEFYKPKMQFYKELSFLSDQDLVSSHDSIENGEYEEQEAAAPMLTLKNDRIRLPLGQIENDGIQNIHKSKYYNGHEENDFLGSMVGKNILLTKHIVGNKDNAILDDASIFSATWAAVFRKLNSEQQVYANKAIMDILYQGQLSRLDENSIAKMDISELSMENARCS